MSNTGIPWEVTRFAVLAAGHVGCALKAMRAQGFKPAENQVEDACAEAKPVTAKLVCDFCCFTTLSETDHKQWVLYDLTTHTGHDYATVH